MSLRHDLADSDPWLDRWLPLAAGRSAGRIVLEVGCGAGRDTSTLAAAGLDVVAIDASQPAIAKARRRVPGARFHCQDLRAPFPAGTAECGAVVASLSLHYFPWAQTRAIVRRIRAALAPGGVLLCRLNSTNDDHYGASGHPRISPYYYRVNGEPKRFFDRAAVLRLFDAGWQFLSLEEQVISRYEKPKVVWEAVLTSAARRKSR
jgi:SAM-dependent methyltransferase